MARSASLAFVLLLVACAALRLIALHADPPAWLDWSTGLQTDEGFYTLDARHETLFGAWAPGDFHDRLLSPLLSGLQQGVFDVFGVGTLQARLISVVFGLLTIIVFRWGLRAAYDERTALAGTFLLGLAPPVVFFNRLALQETPTVFWLVLAFALWSIGEKRPSQATVFWVGSGVALALALVFKTSAVVALPAFLLAARRGGRLALGALGGFAATLAVYGLLWYGPHQTELARMAAYYRDHQIEPHSAHSLWLNLRRGLIDPSRGTVPYLLAMLPVPCVLALITLRHTAVETADRLFAVWLVTGASFCLISSYAPDRYLMLFLPALCALSARGLVGLNRRPLQYAFLALFLVTSGCWYARAWDERSDARRMAALALTRLLPAGSVVIGDVAPALCLDTPFAAAPVQPGLSNDDRPVERLGATHIIVTRAPIWQKWWAGHYPQILTPSHHVAAFRLGGRWHTVVDVYAVQGEKVGT